MSSFDVPRKVVCANCGQEGLTDSPRYRCMECFTTTSIKWPVTAEEFWTINASAKAQKFIATVAEQQGVDARALHILFNTIWNMDGRDGTWTDRGYTWPRAILKEAINAGVMKPALKLNHDATVARTIAARDALDRRTVVAAFVRSLTTRNMAHRSALGSFAQAQHLSPHRVKMDPVAGQCHICARNKGSSIDVNHHTVRRLLFAGNFDQGELNYVMCDLEAFNAEGVDIGKADRDTLKAMLQGLRKLSAKATLRDLEKAIAKAFPSNKDERQVVLEILGFCGILKPADLPSPHKVWINKLDLPQSDHFYAEEWNRPVSCWSGKDGVNEEAVTHWFGDL